MGQSKQLWHSNLQTFFDEVIIFELVRDNVKKEQKISRLSKTTNIFPCCHPHKFGLASGHFDLGGSNTFIQKPQSQRREQSTRNGIQRSTQRRNDYLQNSGNYQQENYRSRNSRHSRPETRSRSRNDKHSNQSRSASKKSRSSIKK